MKKLKNIIEEPDLDAPDNLEDIDDNIFIDFSDEDDTETDDISFDTSMTEHDIVSFIMHGNQR
jgi:hypothetical protein